jgi:putative phosphonate metabolism protein
MTFSRYALYVVPARGSVLGDFGGRWLGRDADEDTALEQPRLGDVAPASVAEITAEARRYGFHATLKPPFRLAEERNEAELVAALEAFARTQSAVGGIPLHLAAISGFLALVPDGRPPALHDLADACVRELDLFRRPVEEAEIARRRRAGLSELEEEMLRRWGYPYVFESFRFHMTLTRRLAPEERARLEPMLRALVAPAVVAPLAIVDLALMIEPTPGANFRVLRRFPLRSPSAAR